MPEHDDACTTPITRARPPGVGLGVEAFDETHGVHEERGISLLACHELIHYFYYSLPGSHPCYHRLRPRPRPCRASTEYKVRSGTQYLRVVRGIKRRLASILPVCPRDHGQTQSGLVIQTKVDTPTSQYRLRTTASEASLVSPTGGTPFTRHPAKGREEKVNSRPIISLVLFSAHAVVVAAAYSPSVMQKL